MYEYLSALLILTTHYFWGVLEGWNYFITKSLLFKIPNRFGGQNFRRTKFFSGQNFLADKIFSTRSKFRQFCSSKIIVWVSFLHFGGQNFRQQAGFSALLTNWFGVTLRTVYIPIICVTLYSPFATWILGKDSIHTDCCVYRDLAMVKYIALCDQPEKCQGWTSRRSILLLPSMGIPLISFIPRIKWWINRLNSSL